MNNASIDLESKAATELAEKHGVKLMRTPEDVLKAQLPAMDKVFDEEAKKNPFFAKVLARSASLPSVSFLTPRACVRRWSGPWSTTGRNSKFLVPVAS